MKDVRIGLLSAAPPTGIMLHALRESLRERGYVEGSNLSIDMRWSQRSLSELPNLALDLVRSNVDVLITWATPATLAARGATSTVPIVMFGTADPVATGVIDSLARPGANVTGVANLARDLSAKQVEIFISAVPTVRKIGIVHNPSPTGVNLLMHEAERAVRVMGLQSQVLEARSPEEFESAFRHLASENNVGAVVLPDPSVIEHGRKIAELALKVGLPTAFQRRESVEAGGLVAYGPPLESQIRQVAYYVHKILTGTKPADLPVEQPTKFELVINLKTAKALGLTVPPALLARADEVVE